MNVIIAGSRWIGAEAEGKPTSDVVGEQQLIYAAIREAHESWSIYKYSELAVIVGRAKGVDTVAEYWAKGNGVDSKPMPADWDKHGKKAGFIRNEDMANAAGPDGRLILIWDGKSRGSKMMLDIAKRRGMVVFEKIVSQKHGV